MRSSLLPVLLIGVIVLGIAGGAGYLLFRDMTPPEFVLAPETKVVTPGQKFTVAATDAGSGIRSITATIRKNSQIQVIGKAEYADKAEKQTAEFAFTDTFLRDGAFTLIINAVDASFAGFGQGNSITKEFALTMDTTPPKVVIKTAYPYVRQGGSGCISFAVSREVKASGVRVNDLYFPGYLQENGDFICFFASPYFIKDGADYQPSVVVTDLAGNKSETRIPLYRVKSRFKFSG